MDWNENIPVASFLNSFPFSKVCSQFILSIFHRFFPGFVLDLVPKSHSFLIVTSYYILSFFLCLVFFFALCNNSPLENRWGLKHFLTSKYHKTALDQWSAVLGQSLEFERAWCNKLTLKLYTVATVFYVDVGRIEWEGNMNKGTSELGILLFNSYRYRCRWIWEAIGFETELCAGNFFAAVTFFFFW